LGADTHTETSRTEAISRNQVCTGQRPACAWFNYTLKIFVAKHTEFELTGKYLRGVLERPKIMRLKFSRPEKNPQNPRKF